MVRLVRFFLLELPLRLRGIFWRVAIRLMGGRLGPGDPGNPQVPPRNPATPKDPDPKGPDPMPPNATAPKASDPISPPASTLPATPRSVPVDLQWKHLSPTDPQWRALEAMPGSTVFHSARWGRVLERGLRGPMILVALVDGGGRVVAGWPGCLMHVGPVRICYGVFPKGNFVGPADLIVPRLAGFQDQLRAMGAHVIRMLVCENDSVYDLAEARHHPHVRHVLDLAGRTPEAVWAGYKQRVRRDVRVAEKAGLTVRPMRREEFPAFDAMLRDVHNRNAAATAVGLAFYEAVWDEMAADGTAEFLVADKDGTPVSATVVIHDPPVSYYFAACSRTDALEMCPNDLLVHTLILRALERGSTQVDFLSSSATDEGLIRFKAKWGSQPRPFTVMERWFSTWRQWAWDLGMRAARHPRGAALVRQMRAKWDRQG